MFFHFFSFSGRLELGNSGIQDYKSSGVQEFRNSGTQELRSSGNQEFRNSGIHEIRNSGIQEIRNSGIQEFRNSRINDSQVSDSSDPYTLNLGLLSDCRMGVVVISLKSNAIHQGGKGEAAPCLLLNWMPCPGQEGNLISSLRQWGVVILPLAWYSILVDIGSAYLLHSDKFSFYIQKHNLHIYRLHPTLLEGGVCFTSAMVRVRQVWLP